MTTSAPSPSPPPPPLALTRVCTVLRVLRFLRFDSLDDILKTAHISDTFRDALECYSATVWRRIASRPESLEDSSGSEDEDWSSDDSSSVVSSSLAAFFKRDAFAWAAHNLLTVGQLDVSGVEKRHPLRVASENGAADVVRICLAVMPYGCVNARSRNGWTALLLAAYGGHAECARELLAAGADITVHLDGATALHFAARGGHVDVVRQLTAHADFAKVRDGWTALQAASDSECVRELLAAGADITLAGNRGWTALHGAAFDGNVAIVRMLAAHADFEKVRDLRDEEGSASLLLASFRGHTECVRELLAAGAKIAVGNKYGETALHNAAQKGNAAIVRMIIAHLDFDKIRDMRNSNDQTAMDCAKTEEIKQLFAKNE